MPVKKTKSPVVAGNKGDTSILSKNGNHSKNGSRSKKSTIPSNGNSNGRTESFDPKELLRVLTEVRNGNFSVRMPFDEVGLNGKICDTLNDIISLNEKMMLEFTRAGNTIGIPKRGPGTWSQGTAHPSMTAGNTTDEGQPEGAGRGRTGRRMTRRSGKCRAAG